MLYNAATLDVLLNPPFTANDISSKIVTIEPTLFGDADLLNFPRFQRLLAQPEQFVFLEWKPHSCQDSNGIDNVVGQRGDGNSSFRVLDFKKQQCFELETPFAQGQRAPQMPVKEVSRFDLIASPELALPSTAANLLEVSMSCSPRQASGMNEPLPGPGNSKALLGLSWLAWRSHRDRKNRSFLEAVPCRSS